MLKLREKNRPSRMIAGIGENGRSSAKRLRGFYEKNYSTVEGFNLDDEIAFVEVDSEKECLQQYNYFFSDEASGEESLMVIIADVDENNKILFQDIARKAKNKGILTVGIFASSEGQKHAEVTKQDYSSIRSTVDALFVFRNPQEDDLPDLMYQCAFSIVGTVCMSNLVGFGIMDLRSFLGNAGLCGFGFGEVPENSELSEEAGKIIDHTYTIMDDEDADKSYIVFSAGDVSLMDVNDAASAADHEQNTVYGLGYYNESMKGKRIMVLSRNGAL